MSDKPVFPGIPIDETPHELSAAKPARLMRAAGAADTASAASPADSVRAASTVNAGMLRTQRVPLWVERTLAPSLEWTVFEPNTASTWARVRTQVTDQLIEQWRAGELQGATAEQAFFVQCGLGTTMTQNDIDDGRLICEVGVAVVKPAEFVVFRIGQWTADQPSRDTGSGDPPD